MKVTIVGAGNVGATTAQRLLESGLCDVYLMDVVEGLARGKALDLQQAAPIVGHSGRISGGETYEEAAGSDVVIITAGVARKPGMSREDLLQINGQIVTEVVQNLKHICPEAIILMISNPLDVTTAIAYEVSGLPRERVIGMAGVLDTARFCTFIALELNVSPQDVFALVLGGHGDLMLPLVRLATVGGVPVTDLLPPERLAEIVARTRNGGAEIVQYLKMGSAFYAPAAAAAQMTAAILRDEKRLLPASVLLQGEYGLQDVFLGVPCILGRQGLVQIVEMALNEEEKAALQQSAARVQAALAEWRQLQSRSQ